MDSELVWLKWNYDLLKIFIRGIQPTNDAYEQIMEVCRVDPSYADVARRMENSYSAKKRQYDQSISDIRRRITRENNRLTSLDEEGRKREAAYIQDWNNTVQEIEEYIRTNVPPFLTEGQSGRLQRSRTQSASGSPSASVSRPVPKPRSNPVRISPIGSTSSTPQTDSTKAAIESIFRNAPWLGVALALILTLAACSVLVVGYVVTAIVPLASMILALEASTKVGERIHQPHEKNFFLYIRCLIPTILNILAFILFTPIVKALNDPGLGFLLDGAGYIKTAFFLQACFFGAVTISFLKGLQNKAGQGR